MDFVTTVLVEVAKNPFKHLFVDLDGTLLGNRALPLTFAFFSSALSVLGKKHGRMSVLRAMRGVYEEFETADPKRKNNERFISVFAKKLKVTEDKAEIIWIKTVEEIFPTLGGYFSPVKGAKDFLNWAKDDYSLILATNPVWPREIIELRLKWAGVDSSLFEWITSWDQMNAVKPLPEYYRGILDHQKLDPANCLMIGDSEKKDLPATKLGIATFILDADSLKKKTAVCVPMKRNPGRADAWWGNYAGLKELLLK